MGAFETNRLQRAQEAVDSTASAYADDPDLGVEQRLEAELGERGFLPQVGNAVIEDLSGAIRAGQKVTLTDEQVPPEQADAPGSMGGDNGGV